jgi:hypothetical protein
MPNASTAAHDEPHRFFLYGDMGGGKSSQILTLPRPTFAYIFDPNSLLTLRGHDIDYEQFLPQDINLDVVSTSKDPTKSAESRAKKRGPVVMNQKATTYEEWERDFDKKRNSGFFDSYNSIAVDSVTSFLDVIMDYVLSINGRPGQWPEQDDYGPQMVTFTNVMRTIASMGKTVLCTGHYEAWQDRKTMRTTYQLMMTGRLRTKIPLLFSDVWFCEGGIGDDGKSQFTVTTVKDKHIPAARCSFRDMPAVVDVTLDFHSDLEQQGLGALILNELDELKPKEKPATKASAKRR